MRRHTQMHPADIKAALIKRGHNLSTIARQLRVSHSLVSRVVSGQVTSRRAAHAVAEAAGLSVERMWPGRYAEPLDRAAA